MRRRWAVVVGDGDGVGFLAGGDGVGRIGLDRDDDRLVAFGEFAIVYWRNGNRCARLSGGDRHRRGDRVKIASRRRGASYGDNDIQGLGRIAGATDGELPGIRSSLRSIRIVGDAQAGKGCIEYEWNSELTSCGSASIRHLFEPQDEVYYRFYLKLSKGWGWTGRNYHPHLTHFLTTENSEYHGPAASHLTLYIEPVNGKLRLAATDIQNKDMPHGLTQGELRGGYNGKLYDSKEVLFNDDEWHCIEAYFKLNTLDMENDRPNPDGIVRGWFDGELVVAHTDVILRSTDFPEMKINQFLMAPYFGPGLLPHAQKLWIDELSVGTKRIGALP